MCLISGALMGGVVALYWAGLTLAGVRGFQRPEGWEPVFQPRMRLVRYLLAFGAGLVASGVGGAMLYWMLGSALR